MAISTKYGKVDIGNIGEEEPVFILRAQDKLAEAALMPLSTIIVAINGKFLKIEKSKGVKD